MRKFIIIIETPKGNMVHASDDMTIKERLEMLSCTIHDLTCRHVEELIDDENE